jgi:protoheme IX farnesyltransferase
MSKNVTVSLERNEKTYDLNQRNIWTVISDLTSLLKGFVLVANVLPVLTGFWLALHFTNASIFDYWNVFLLTMIGSTLVMAGALTLNNWYEVDLDRVMERTKDRPTVTGHFSMNAVLTMGIAFTILGFILLLFTTVEATIYAFIGWFTYVILYTMWSKRKYTLNTMIGAVSGAVTPLIGWTVIAPGFHIVPITLALIVLIWQMPHTFAIAMRRYNEYKRAGVAMLPVVYGFEITKRQIVVYIACLLPLPFFLGSLGTAFIVIATLLNIGWLVVGIRGLFTKNDIKWANRIFIYSVNYLTILFVMMILVTWG